MVTITSKKFIYWIFAAAFIGICAILLILPPNLPELSTNFSDDGKCVDFGYFSLFFFTNYVMEVPDDWFLYRALYKIKKMHHFCIGRCTK